MSVGLIVVRGLPGSGKSTLAQRLSRSFGHVHLEADQFFIKNGHYHFDAGQLAAAHGWCQSETDRYMSQGMTVVVSNTFTTLKELRPYFVIAERHGVVPQVIHCQNQYGNIHHVPHDTMERMRARWACDISELFTGVVHESH
jgi:predicted kinase